MDPSQQQPPQNILDVSAPTQMHAPPAHAPPLSDLEIAAQYAESEIQSVAEQFAGTSVASAPQPPVIAASSNVQVSATSNDDSDDNANDSDAEDGEVADAASASSSDDDDDDDDTASSANKLRAEIEAAMKREENKASVALKTANEVAVVPVRQPSVELTPDCPIARCGTILSVSVPGLMVTIKSDLNMKPLDEESVLCFDDRTVLGCVDEVFGPVMMPMYLVRFEHADKMPSQAVVNTVVYYATEHTTYIVPEAIRDKGTDASNIFDEEDDDLTFSDDEAESAAKRMLRKRGRNVGAHANDDDAAVDGSNITDYRAGSNLSSRSGRGGNSSRGGRNSSSGGGGRGRGGGNGRSSSIYGPSASSSSMQQSHETQQPSTSSQNPNTAGYVQSQPPQQFQTQSHGGHTHYTQPGFAMPPQPHMAYAAPPLAYGQPQPPHPSMPYSNMPMHPQQQQQMYQHHQQHQQQQQHFQPPMPAYAPPPPMPGQQPQQQQQFYHHAQPPLPPPQQQQQTQQHYGAPPPPMQYAPQTTGYYAPPQQQQQAPQQPPLPPGPYNNPPPPPQQQQ